MHAAKTWLKLRGPDGLIPVESWRLRWAKNEGWQWGVSIPTGILSPDFAADTTFTMTLTDGRGAMIVPPRLIAIGPRNITWGESGLSMSIAGTDVTTQKLAKRGQNFDTFRNSTANAIASSVGSAFGVTIQNAPTFPVFEEDIKQSNGWDPLKRLAKACGRQLLVDASGRLCFTNYGWSAGSLNFKASGGSWTYDPSQRVTEITFVKQCSMEQAERDLTWDSSGWKMQALPTPLSHIVPVDLSSNGAVVLIGFWDGDPSAGGALISGGYWPMGIEEGAFLSVDQSGSWPATHITCSVMEASPPFDQAGVQARLKLQGSSPTNIPTGIDVAFEYKYTAPGASPSLPAESVYSEQLYPSLAFVQEVAPAILWDSSKEGNKVECEGPLDVSGQLGDDLEPMPLWGPDGSQVAETPEAVCWAFDHSWSGGDSEPTTSVLAYGKT